MYVCLIRSMTNPSLLLNYQHCVVVPSNYLAQVRIYSYWEAFDIGTILLSLDANSRTVWLGTIAHPREAINHWIELAKLILVRMVIFSFVAGLFPLGLILNGGHSHQCGYSYTPVRKADNIELSILRFSMSVYDTLKQSALTASKKKNDIRIPHHPIKVEHVVRKKGSVSLSDTTKAFTAL